MVYFLNCSLATTLHVLNELLLRFFWQLRRSVEELASHKLLSVPVGDRTPNIVFARGERSFSGAAPSILRFPDGRPARSAGPLTPTQKERIRNRAAVPIKLISTGHLRARHRSPNIARVRSRVCGPAPQSQSVAPGCCLWQSAGDTSGSTGCLVGFVTKTRRSQWPSHARDGCPPC